jgi:predicted RNase H-like HicB family nuclease
MKWRVILERDYESGDWAIWCPELPGCTSCGETKAEALDNIREAIDLYLEPSSIELTEDSIIDEVTV